MACTVSSRPQEQTGGHAGGKNICFTYLEYTSLPFETTIELEQIWAVRVRLPWLGLWVRIQHTLPLPIPPLLGLIQSAILPSLCPKMVPNPTLCLFSYPVSISASHNGSSWICNHYLVRWGGIGFSGRFCSCPHPHIRPDPPFGPLSLHQFHPLLTFPCPPPAHWSLTIGLQQHLQPAMCPPGVEAQCRPALWCRVLTARNEVTYSTCTTAVAMAAH